MTGARNSPVRAGLGRIVFVVMLLAAVFLTPKEDVLGYLSATRHFTGVDIGVAHRAGRIDCHAHSAMPYTISQTTATSFEGMIAGAAQERRSYHGQTCPSRMVTRGPGSTRNPW
jgi:hypothetical protein